MIQQQIKCVTHPTRPVCCVQIRKEFQSDNRLLCLKCIQKQKISTDDVIDIIDFIESPLNMLSIPNRKLGALDELNIFFELQNRDPEIIIEEYRKMINNEIDQFLQKLHDKIQEFRQFQNKIKKAKEQFCEALGRPNLIEKLSQIQKIENYKETKEWKELNKDLEENILQFHNQDNQELKSTLHNLKQIEFSCHNYSKELNDLKAVTQKLCSQLEVELRLQTTDNILYSTLLSKVFLEQVKTTIEQEFPIKSKLLFRGTEHGMNASEFWNRCKNQGPTLIVCKSANGTVFGGYTPCKWADSGKYQQDQSKTSFLFNQNRQEFYPLFNPQYAIYNQSSYGPTFGGNTGYDLYITSDFKGGSSSLGYNYRVNKEKNQQFNQTTHLMGAAKPDLVEMEVYLLEIVGK